MRLILGLKSEEEREERLWVDQLPKNEEGMHSLITYLRFQPGNIYAWGKLFIDYFVYMGDETKEKIYNLMMRKFGSVSALRCYFEEEFIIAYGLDKKERDWIDGLDLRKNSDQDTLCEYLKENTLCRYGWGVLYQNRSFLAERKYKETLDELVSMLGEDRARKRYSDLLEDAWRT